MGWICRNCGERTFKAARDYTNSGSESMFINERGEEYNWDDSDEERTDNGELEDIECLKCGSDNVEQNATHKMIKEILELIRKRNAPNWKDRIEG